ncbi:MAG: PIN domain-containing protein [Sulfuricaulis sp.]
MTDSVFLDSNVLVYLVDSSVPAKQQRAREILDKWARAGHALISTQVLQEFYVVVTRKLAKPLDEKTAEQAVRDFTALGVVEIVTPMILAAVSRSRRARLSLWDALIVEAAIAGGATRLYSEDFQHGRTFEGLRVENPFAKDWIGTEIGRELK